MVLCIGWSWPGAGARACTLAVVTPAHTVCWQHMLSVFRLLVYRAAWWLPLAAAGHLLQPVASSVALLQSATIVVQLWCKRCQDSFFSARQCSSPQDCGPIPSSVRVHVRLGHRMLACHSRLMSSLGIDDAAFTGSKPQRLGC